MLQRFSSLKKIKIITKEVEVGIKSNAKEGGVRRLRVKKKKKKKIESGCKVIFRYPATSEKKKIKRILLPYGSFFMARAIGLDAAHWYIQ